MPGAKADFGGGQVGRKSGWVDLPLGCGNSGNNRGNCYRRSDDGYFPVRSQPRAVFSRLRISYKANCVPDDEKFRGSLRECRAIRVYRRSCIRAIVQGGQMCATAACEMYIREEGGRLKKNRPDCGEIHPLHDRGYAAWEACMRDTKLLKVLAVRPAEFAE